MKTKLLKGNNIELLKTLEPNSIDSVLTDAPYGLSFMNKKWDYDVPSVEFWKEVYRVLKPGGHILCFGGTRTYHRMVVNIEDAGFEIRDCIQWIYGSGFPKSLNIGKSIDEYEGWGTGLKPANEPIVLVRKPLDKKTIVENVKEWGTGGINIDGCRIGYQNDGDYKNFINNSNGINRQKNSEVRETYFNNTNIIGNHNINDSRNEGRFPANVILDEEAAEVMDEQNNGTSRFFYVAKVSKKERNLALDDFEEKENIIYMNNTIESSYKTGSGNLRNTKMKNNHPTVKPINLLTYLVRMITPPDGVVLDAYMGSGSTGIAALLEGFNFVGMEMDEDYFNIAEARINNYEQYRKLLK